MGLAVWITNPQTIMETRIEGSPCKFHVGYIQGLGFRIKFSLKTCNRLYEGVATKRGILMPSKVLGGWSMTALCYGGLGSEV